MCGIAGFAGGRWVGIGHAGDIARNMAACLAHRGPDHSEVWVDSESSVALAFARLAIVDLSPAGHQPMVSHSGRHVLIFNGEVYNHAELREQLMAGGHRGGWRGHSDTETLLEAIEAWGIERALKRATGMYAFALWDKAERRLILARDRLGEKPLYYGREGDGAASFLFGSELKALARHPQFRGEIDRDALALFLRYNYIPAPHSIYRGISKLPPGSYLVLREGAEAPEIHSYWSGADVARAGVADPLDASPEEALDQLEALLEDAVGKQMVADVPLGAFLSGGIDSSTIVALMQKISDRPVKTFTIGFHEPGYNEADHAKAVAAHLGTEHTELYVSPEEARAVIPKLPTIYDEPFADSSQIPTYLVAQLARRHVTVSLSGDGGDELFGGYNRYRFTEALWGRISGIPQPLRRAAARGLTAMPTGAWNRVGRVAGRLLPSAVRGHRLGDKIHKGAPLLRSRSAAELYGGMLSQWNDPGSVVIGAREPPSQANGHVPDLQGLGEVERMMALDMLAYLPDDILVKVDRAAMAVSLETRVPFLDHRVVEFAWRLPYDYKLRDGQTKWILRRLLERHVPRGLIERPKMGFGVPLGDWLRGPLRDWAEELLDERRLASEGFFRPEPIRSMWEAHLRGSVDEQYRLWVILMFQSWLEAQGHSSAERSPCIALAN